MERRKKAGPFAIRSTLLLFSISGAVVRSQDWADIVVDAHGRGDYATISEAIDALPMYPYQRTVIYIRKGVYEEKVRIDQNYVTLRGESRDSTVIRYSQLRSDWEANKDHIGPAVVNIDGDDIVLDNLTIENTQSEIGPHAFAVYSDGTRTIIIRCNVISKGGDTVSLWNYKNGMYYHDDCFFQGAVDFVCPRGWCFIRDSEFYEVKESASLWHAGHYHPDQKLVVKNSAFDGVPGFKLGRHHYEAQFYLLDCRFSSAMANAPIYRVTYKESSKNNPYLWGDRKYFGNCQRESGDYGWFRDNLDEAMDHPRPEDVTPAWTFGGRWDPESTIPPNITQYHIKGKTLLLIFDEAVTVRGKPVLRSQAGSVFKIVLCRFTDNARLQFASDTSIREVDLAGGLVLEEGEIIASTASVYERCVPSTIQLGH